MQGVEGRGRLARAMSVQVVAAPIRQPALSRAIPLNPAIPVRSSAAPGSGRPWRAG